MAFWTNRRLTTLNPCLIKVLCPAINRVLWEKARMRALNKAMIRACRLLVSGLCLLLTQAVHSQPAPRAEQPALVAVEIQYHGTEATEVYLVWGLNGWLVVPGDEAPPGTVVKKDLMYTPMIRAENTFTVKLQVPDGATIDYMFRITRKADGWPVDAWDMDAVSGDGYQMVARDHGIARIEMSPGLIPDSGAFTDDVAFVEQRIEYLAADVRQVSLVWGIDGWRALPPDFRPEGTSIKDHLMVTPMSFDGAVFSAVVRAPFQSRIDFAFEITRLRDDMSVSIWQSDEGGGYQLVADRSSTVKIEPSLLAMDSIFSHLFGVRFLPLVAIVLASCLLAGTAGVLIASLKKRGNRVSGFILKSESVLRSEGQRYRLRSPVIKAIFFAPLLIAVMFLFYLIVGLHTSPYFQYVLQENTPYTFQQQVIKENGFVEIATVVFLFLASFIALAIARKFWKMKDRDINSGAWKAGLFLMLAVASFIIAMEEISWGQWIFFFDTPTAFKDLNAQGEFNLHNLQIFQSGGKELPLIVFGLAGLVSLLFSSHRILHVVAAPSVLIPWFGTIVLLCIFLYMSYWPELYSDYLSPPGITLWYARQFAEVIEMMVEISAFLFVWLKFREFGMQRSTESR